jgi:hypothetical protein
MKSLNGRCAAYATGASSLFWLNISIVMFILLFCTGCSGRPTLVYGTAYVNGVPCPSAGVILESFGHGDTTTTADRDGHYEFKDVPPGKYLVRIYYAHGAFNLGQEVEIRVFGGRRRVDLHD